MVKLKSTDIGNDVSRISLEREAVLGIRFGMRGNVCLDRELVERIGVGNGSLNVSAPVIEWRNRL